MRLSSELAACQMSILAERADFLSGDSANSPAGLSKKKNHHRCISAYAGLCPKSQTSKMCKESSLE